MLQNPASLICISVITDVHDNACQTPVFGIGPSTATSRLWDIQITQYSCGDDNGGPVGCLQYFTGTTGTLASYGFSGTAVVAATTHLQDQAYENCFRREKGYCHICFYPTLTGTPAAIVGNSFSLSLNNDAAILKATTGTACATDYIAVS